jgi:hypothetical protein
VKRGGRRSKLAELRVRRRTAMERARVLWSKLEPAGRAFVLCHRAQLWTYHPAAIAVERSAEARLAKLQVAR